MLDDQRRRSGTYYILLFASFPHPKERVSKKEQAETKECPCESRDQLAGATIDGSADPTTVPRGMRQMVQNPTNEPKESTRTRPNGKDYGPMDRQ